MKAASFLFVAWRHLYASVNTRNVVLGLIAIAVIGRAIMSKTTSGR
jgi:multisubunit Na+/H+ antiporter MnhE subunit